MPWVHRCKDYEDFRQTLLQLSVSPDAAEDLLVHERAHFEKAKSLGYNPVYCIRIIPGSSPVIPIGGLIDYDGEEPTKEDLIAILLAPETPSEHDLKLADELRSH